MTSQRKLKSLRKDFKQMYPNLQHMACGYFPNDDDTIIVALKGGEKMIYDGCRAYFIQNGYLEGGEKG